MSDGLRRKLPGLLLALVVVLYLYHGATFVMCERPNQDEGWYLYAAKLVIQGRRPYLDFAYVQPPLLPYVYGLLGGWHSLQAGRTVSLFCGALVVLLVGLGARRAGNLGMLTAAALLAFCPFVLSQQSIVKAYALADVFLAGGLALAVWAHGRKTWLAAAGACFALAALTRNSAAPAVAGYLLWLGANPRTRAAMLPALAATVGVLALGYAPFVLVDAGDVKFHLLEHHAANLPAFDPFVSLLTAAVVAQLVIRACQPLTAALLAGFGVLAWPDQEPSELRAEVGLGLLLSAVIFLGHFVSGHPYQEYQVLALPTAALTAGLLWGEMERRADRRLVRVIAAALAGVMPLLALGPSKADLMGNQPGPDGRRPPAGVHTPLRQVAQLVSRHCPPDQKLFTFQTDIAIEAGRDLCDGLTLASFSFSGSPEATAHHLVNAASITATFEAAEPAVIVLSPGDLANLLHGMPTPDGGFAVVPELGDDMKAVYGPLIAAMDRHYVEVGQVAGVGQFAETMRVLARRSPR